MVNAIIFDCFGVVITDALQALTDELGRSNPSAVAQVKDIVRTMNRGLSEPEAAKRQLAGIFEVSLEEFREKIADGEAKNPSLLNYISSLRKTYKTAMLSNIPGDSLRRRFAKGELENYFDVVVASGDIGYAKPEARAYEIVAEKLAVRLNECVFIDDRSVYCEGAQAVGMKAIAYKDFVQMKQELEEILEAS
jgi:epoxide hydrolase-like predicted phosphatase